jgi:hypothetical protein
LNTRYSSSDNNLHHVNTVELKPLPKGEALRENSRQKGKVGALLADIPVKAALEACAKSKKCKDIQ